MHIFYYCEGLVGVQDDFFRASRQDIRTQRELEYLCWTLYALDAGQVGVLKLQYFGRVLRFWNERCDPERPCKVPKPESLVCFDALYRWWRSRTDWCYKNLKDFQRAGSGFTERFLTRDIDITQAWQVANQLSLERRQTSLYYACDVSDRPFLDCKCPILYRDEKELQAILWDVYVMWALDSFRFTYCKTHKPLSSDVADVPEPVLRPSGKAMPRPGLPGVFAKSLGAPPCLQTSPMCGVSFGGASPAVPSSIYGSSSSFAGPSSAMVPRPSSASPLRASAPRHFPSRASESEAGMSRVSLRFHGPAVMGTSRSRSPAVCHLEVSHESFHSLCSSPSTSSVNVSWTVSRGGDFTPPDMSERKAFSDCGPSRPEQVDGPSLFAA